MSEAISSFQSAFSPTDLHTNFGVPFLALLALNTNSQFAKFHLGDKIQMVRIHELVFGWITSWQLNQFRTLLWFHLEMRTYARVVGFLCKPSLSCLTPVEQTPCQTETFRSQTPPSQIQLAKPHTRVIRMCEVNRPPRLDRVIWCRFAA